MATEPENSDPQVLIDKAFQQGGAIQETDFADLGKYLQDTGSTLLQFSVFGEPIDTVSMLIRVPVDQFGALLDSFVADDSYRIPFKVEVLSKYTYNPTVIIIYVTWGPGG